MTRHPERILVRGVNWLGDAVMTTPALLRLRERFPQAHITLLTPQKLGDLWLHHRAADAVNTFAPGEGVFSVSRKLRAGNFDLALVLPNSLRSALQVWLAGIPQRIGYVGPWRNWLLTQTVPIRPGHERMHKRSASEIRQLIDTASRLTHHPSRLTHHPSRFTHHPSRFTHPGTAHHIHQYLHLAAVLGATAEPLPPLLSVLDEEVAAVARRFGLSEKTPFRPVFGLNPGAEYGPAKRWPRERFVAAAIELQKRADCRWVIFGGQAEVQLADEIAADITQPASRIPPPLNLAGKTSLRELMALLKLCRVLLTNDSGPMHVAAALGTPVVAAFGSTSPELTGPGLPGNARHRLLVAGVPCSPCFLRECPIDFRCMNGISVEQVVDAVSNVIAA